MPAQKPISNTAALPAPVYYLGRLSGSDQIWRVEVDGQTAVQVTHELSPVTDFDVSPTDGKLAFVSNNNLILANPDGSRRTVMVDAHPMPTAEDYDVASLLMRQVHWSPDGKRIAYGLGGVNLIDAHDGRLTVLKRDDLKPKSPDFKSDGPVYSYWPLAWSPDGTRILSAVASYPEGGSLTVLDVSDMTTVDFVSNAGNGCCSPSWSVDGKSVYYASPWPWMDSSGLWHAEASTGKVTTLIEGFSKTEWREVGFVHAAKHGVLYYFYGTQSKEPGDLSPDSLPMALPITMYSAQADGVSERRRLRNDVHIVSEVAWAPNEQGALIVDVVDAVRAPSYQVSGTLTYLKTDSSPAIRLPADGRLPHWGVPSSTPVVNMQRHDTVWESHIDLVDGNASDCKY
ncbi:MAG: DPP IV N-terminal domain-containing protein [Chloroflexi bacterium]|nr:DPP IV N-terminal domain-containing protein [Chloroflexota bacterium]MCL5274668.1 DPP IV N-terminal domain-containing protein [Chloroflexota bacterium]